MARLMQILLALLLASVSLAIHVEEAAGGHHHGHHRHHHGHHGHHHHHHNGSDTLSATPATAVLDDSPARQQPAAAKPPAAPDAKRVVAGAPVQAAEATHPTKAALQVHTESSDEQIVQKMRALERELSAKEFARTSLMSKGQLDVNGPLPADFSDRFAAGVAEATGCSPNDVEVLGAVPVPEAKGHVDEILFQAHRDVVAAVEDQAADPSSKLATGPLHLFLVDRDGAEEEGDEDEDAAPDGLQPTGAAPEVDTAMPYGDLEPFGREDTAQELTESSIRESNAMVDQLERAEVAEEKRAVFRALTRLRGAAITSYDGIARSQTGNIDEYAQSNQWRKAHPIHHLAEEEADVSKWAFPSTADF